MLIIHNYSSFILGVGKSLLIQVASQWAEKILIKVGDHPMKPRILLMAFTGKAASLIGKRIFSIIFLIYF